MNTEAMDTLTARLHQADAILSVLQNHKGLTEMSETVLAETLWAVQELVWQAQAATKQIDKPEGPPKA